jgi:basic membrane lipoprotein Med (substrate-binding protein (PBP1-ABC) superfamily)
MPARALVTSALVLSTLLLSTGCAKNSKPAPPPPLRIAMVIDTSERGDAVLNDSAVAGLQATKDMLGADTALLRAETHAAYQADLTLLVDQDYDEVFAVGGATTADVTAVARHYPRRTFALVDGISQEPNVASIVFRVHEAAFLAGALAALVGKGRAPAVTSSPTDPRASALRAGFVAGARDMRAATQAPPLGASDGTNEEPAGTLYDLSGTPTFTTSAGPVHGRVLARIIERADVAVLAIAEDAASLKLPGGPAPFGLAQRGVELGLTARARSLAGAAGLAKLAELHDAIVAGTIVPPRTATQLAAYKPLAP